MVKKYAIGSITTVKTLKCLKKVWFYNAVLHEGRLVAIWNKYSIIQSQSVLGMGRFIGIKAHT